MGADEEEHQSPARKREREEGEEPAAADEKHPRTADESDGASLLGLANYADEEEEHGAPRGHANGRPREEEEEEDDEDEEEDERRAPERRPRQVELHRDCPYLDTVNRQVLLFFVPAFWPSIGLQLPAV